MSDLQDMIDAALRDRLSALFVPGDNLLLYGASGASHHGLLNRSPLDRAPLHSGVMTRQRRRAEARGQG